MMTTDWTKLKVVDLKAELKRRGLPQNGLKQELVNRLKASDAEAPTSENQPTPEPPASAESTPVAAEIVAQPEVDEKSPQDIQTVEEEPAPPTTAPETQAVLSQETPPAENAIPTSTNEGDAGDEKEASSRLDTPAAVPSELIQDAQKRKRRSSTPTPSAKRVRPYDEQEGSVESKTSENTPSGHQNGVKASTTYEEVVQKRHTPAAELSRPIADEGKKHPSRPESRDSVINTGEEAYRARVALSETRSLAPQESTEIYSATDNKSIEPAIHPATTALYIKNFMRPLRAPMVQDYLIELATPPGQSPDPDVIVDFYLDQVRTHAFVQFQTIASASRVRSVLHSQVWPDERNRKALWVDFIPPEKLREWVEMEQSGGRGNFVRWEVIYDQNEDGVITRLEEAGPDARPPKAPAASVAPRQPSSLSGSNRIFPGIEAAPRGPRNLGGPRPGPGPVPRSDPNALRTRANPPLTYQPVGEDLARRRVDNIHSFVSKHASRNPGGDLNRYTFENGDSFVDRGKEVFVGIRPPHRERERRERERRGRGGGGMGRRDGPPPYPRGDRYFGSRDDHRAPPSRFNDDRYSRNDDDRRPRYRDFRDERSGRDNYRDSYRDRRY